MSKKIDPTEIVNPKKTLIRREAEASAPAASAARDEGATGQGMFLYGNKPKPKSEAEERRKKKDFLELQRRRDRELKSSQDQFEESFRSDSSEPLTDAVRAARTAAGGPAAKEDAEFAAAFNEEDKAAS